MNKKQEARFTMANNEVKLLDINHAIWKDDAIVSGSIDKAKTKISNINNTLQEQRIDTKGYTNQKTKYRDVVDKNLDYLFAAFRGYAKINNDEVLYQDANISLSKISKISDTEIIPFFDKNIDYAQQHLQELDAYGINQDMLDKAKTNLTNYQDLLSMPRDITAIRAAATKKLKTQVNDLVLFFDDVLDNLMVKYRRSHPDFYQQYLNARIIVDNPTTALSIKGTVVDADGKKPLQHVKVTVKFKAGSELADYHTKTTEKGNYQFKGIPDGKCKLIFELEYYDKLVVDSTVYTGKATDLDVQLTKNS